MAVLLLYIGATNTDGHPQVIKLMLTGMETALNQVLRLDPETLKKLDALNGKSVKIELTDWETEFYILPYRQGLQLLSDYHKEPDTIIKGKLINLVKVGAAGATTTSMFDESVAISGDTRTGEAMRDVLRNIDIDWEEHLSKIVGDVAAHKLAYHFKKTVAFGKKSVRSLGENIQEYLHYESKQLPTKAAVENFYQGVSKLRDDVDRMEARVKRLNPGRKT